MRVHHLHELFLTVEGRLHGSFLDKMHLQYKEPLPVDLQQALQRFISSGLDISACSGLLRDLIANYLAEPQCPPSGPIKEYLEYSTNDELEDVPWFRAFPDELLLMYAFDVYNQLLAAVGPATA